MRRGRTVVRFGGVEEPKGRTQNQREELGSENPKAFTSSGRTFRWPHGDFVHPPPPVGVRLPVTIT